MILDISWKEGRRMPKVFGWSSQKASRSSRRLTSSLGEGPLEGLLEVLLEAPGSHKPFYKGFYALPEASGGFRGSFLSLMEGTDPSRRASMPFSRLLEASGGPS